MNEEQLKRGLETMAEIETLKRQLQEARNALEIVADRSMHRLHQPSESLADYVLCLQDIFRSARIGAHRASDEFQREQAKV